MKVIVGLGNPGKEYARTPHNAGFEVVDRVAGSLGATIRRSLRFRARMAQGVLAGGTVWLVQPVTYMNASGSAVASILRVKGGGPGDLVVVLDDADLDVGKLRIRARGGSGGHKGLASVIEAVGTDEFARVRVGIGRDDAGGGLVERVLRTWSADERRQVEPVLDRAAEAVRWIVESGVDAAMNRFNG